jgi:CRP-like cAMP-binding protein
LLATAGVGRKRLKHGKKETIVVQGEDADAVFYVFKV